MSLPASLAIVDVETTGANPVSDRITEIAILRVEDGRVTERWSSLVNPGRPIPDNIQTLIGITDEMVADAAGPEHVVGQFATYAADSVLVAHHASFDFGFLHPVAQSAGVPLEPLTIDTMLLSAVLEPDPEARHGLDYVCERYGVEVFGRHTALGMPWPPRRCWYA